MSIAELETNCNNIDGDSSLFTSFSNWLLTERGISKSKYSRMDIIRREMIRYEYEVDTGIFKYRVSTLENDLKMLDKYCPVKKYKDSNYSNYSKCRSLACWLLIKYDMTYQEFKVKVGEERCRLIMEFKEDTGNAGLRRDGYWWDSIHRRLVYDN